MSGWLLWNLKIPVGRRSVEFNKGCSGCLSLIPEDPCFWTGVAESAKMFLVWMGHSTEYINIVLLIWDLKGLDKRRLIVARYDKEGLGAIVMTKLHELMKRHLYDKWLKAITFNEKTGIINLTM